MAKAKIAITLDARTVQEVDELVESRIYPSRSKVIQDALTERLARIKKTRLAREAAKANPKEEQGLAEEGMAEDFKNWPKY